ncbi:MAG: hypothetical protein K8S54_05285 [Spirochaetia bacterium]|nr:hypothetical protein [Spirochaetia bacterium]
MKLRAAILLVCLSVTGALMGDRRIPGIDSIPAAQGDTAQPVQPEKQTSPQPTQQSPIQLQPQPTNPATQTTPAKETDQRPQPAVDAIKKLKVETAPAEFPYSARITWEVDPTNDTEIYVARFVRPPATKQLVLESENITTPPLGPRETSYLDRNMPEGSYYYAVVTGYQLSKRGTLVLKADENYSARPFIVQRKRMNDDPRTQQTPNNPTNDSRPTGATPQVSGLIALSSPSSVKLNWLAAGGVAKPNYVIYRGTQPFTNQNSFATSTRLGTTTEDRLNFEDSSPISDRIVYYGVTVQDRDSGREYRSLTEGVSFLAYTHRIPVMDASVEPFLPRSLVTYLVNKNTIKLIWVDPAATITGYQVFRSSRPIASAAELDRSYLIGRVTRQEASYTDTGLGGGMYFYALIPIDEQGRPVRALAEGRTFTGFGVQIRDSKISEIQPETKKDEKKEDKKEEIKPEIKQDPRMSLFRASVREDSVNLTWSVDNVVRGDRFLLYRSTAALRSLADVRSNGVLLSELEWDTRQYLDAKLPAGKFNYAIVILHDGRVDEKMEEGRNYLPLPAQVRVSAIEPQKIEPAKVEPNKTDETAGTDRDINEILAHTFEKGRYEACIQRLMPYRKDKSEAIRARALLYTGISYFKLGQFKTARPFFVEPVVKAQLPERANFWYKRSLEKLR